MMKIFVTLFIVYFLQTGMGVCQQSAVAAAGIDKTVDSLLNLSNDFLRQRQLEKALECDSLAWDLSIKYAGDTTLFFAKCCFNRGMILWQKGDFTESEINFNRALHLREGILEKNHPDIALCIYHIAILDAERGMFEQAELKLLDAKSQFEKSVGKFHPHYSSCAKDLAMVYYVMASYRKSEVLLLEVREIREKIYGKKHPEYLECLNNLGLLYNELNNFEKAELYYFEAVHIWENEIREEDPDFANALDNLASLYQNLASFEKAERLHIKAKDMRLKLLGRDNRDYANSLNNLANLYKNMGQLDRAEAYYLESKELEEKLSGINHPRFAGNLINLASFYITVGKNEKAEQLLVEAKELFEVRLKFTNHPFYTNCLNTLAVLYFNQAAYDKAEPLYIQAMEQEENWRGRETFEYVFKLNNLANLYKNKREYAKAEHYYSDMSFIFRKLISQGIYYMSENELKGFVDKFYMTQILPFSIVQITNSDSLIKLCFDNLLFYKGFLLNAVQQLKQLALTDTSAQLKFNELKALHTQLAAQYAKPLAYRDSTMIFELREKVDKYEKQIARTVKAYSGLTKEYNWSDVRNHLKKGEAVLEFINYRYVPDRVSDSIMYAALLLRYDQSVIKFIPLVEEKELLKSIQKNNSHNPQVQMNQLYATRGAGQLVTQNYSGLYEMLWKPLEPYLSGIQSIYFSPTGELNRLNFNAIPVQNSTLLSDTYRLSQVGSARQICLPEQNQLYNKQVALFGGLLYDGPEEDSLKDEKPIDEIGKTPQEEQSKSNHGMKGASWEYLPGTEEEIRDLGKLFKSSHYKVMSYSGSMGTEKLFKAMVKSGSSPGIIHLATHGYFFSDAMREVSKLQFVAGRQEPVFKSSEQPMLRSGLILSGGNAGWRGERKLVDQEDGVLTAYEISQLDLSNTELVVLSACETGLGDIQGNEGVYGLQRAFKIAGVKYIIMSLWQVPDKQTSMLMTTFYKNWLENKMTIPDAFHAAQKELRDLGFDPYQWAGFVLIE